MLILFTSVVGVSIAMYVLRKIIFGHARICTNLGRIHGKTVIITGANSGIGFETAMGLARRGARVIMACRSKQRAMPAVEKVKASCGNDNVVFEELDVESYESIYAFVERIKRNEDRVDVLINNAGVNLPRSQKTSKGIDATFAINHLGPFLLTYLLTDLLKASAPSRIINVSSAFHRLCFGLRFNKENGMYKNLTGYEASKLANILHAKELSKRLAGSGVTAYSLHPGMIDTGIWQAVNNYLPWFLAIPLSWLLRWFFWTPFEGAQTSIYLAVEEVVKHLSGKYFSNCQEAKPSKYATSPEQSEMLWNVSEELTGLKENNKK